MIRDLLFKRDFTFFDIFAMNAVGVSVVLVSSGAFSAVMLTVLLVLLITVDGIGRKLTRLK